MLVAIYTRLSPNPDKNDTVNQERELLEFVERSKWTVYKVYTDVDTSGDKKGEDRKSFKEMMLDASQRRFDLLLFWALDRLTREGTLATLKYLDTLEKYGVMVKSFTESYIDSAGPMKDVFIAFMASVAKLEREKLIQRTKVGLETARRKGIKLGRAYATTQTKTRPNPVSIEEVKRLRGEGKTLKQIAVKVNASQATISRMLRRLDESVDKNGPKAIRLEDLCTSD